jgi:hypothetical protein
MAAVLAVNSYLINAFTPLSDAVDAFKARPVLPLQRRRPGPERGAEPLHLLFLAFLTFVFLSVAQITFDRRDVGTA